MSSQEILTFTSQQSSALRHERFLWRGCVLVECRWARREMNTPVLFASRATTLWCPRWLINDTLKPSEKKNVVATLRHAPYRHLVLKKSWFLWKMPYNTLQMFLMFTKHSRRRYVGIVSSLNCGFSSVPDVARHQGPQFCAKNKPSFCSGLKGREHKLYVKTCDNRKAILVIPWRSRVRLECRNCAAINHNNVEHFEA